MAFQEEAAAVGWVSDRTVCLRVGAMSGVAGVFLLLSVASWQVVASMCLLAGFFASWQYVNVVCLARLAFQLKLAQAEVIAAERQVR